MRDRKSQWNLLVTNMPVLHAYVRRLVGARASARETTNEIMQEVSLRILCSDGPGDSLGGGAPVDANDRERFLAWARGLARHVAAHDWRMRQRARTQLPLDGELPEEIHDPRADPERQLDARSSLARAVVDLDHAGLELLVRRYLYEETGRELADEMAQSPAAVRMRLMRLRSSLSGRAGRRNSPDRP